MHKVLIGGIGMEGNHRTSDVVKTRVIKRNGTEVSFDIEKIINAITAANNEVKPIHRMNEPSSWDYRRTPPCPANFLYF